MSRIVINTIRSMLWMGKSHGDAREACPEWKHGVDWFDSRPMTASIDQDNNPNGFILVRPTGVSFYNQCRGLHCAHPHIEGVYIPLEYGSLSDAASEWEDRDLSVFDCRQILRNLHKQHGSPDFTFQALDVPPTIPDNVAASADALMKTEAWMPALLTKWHSRALDEPALVVLVWENSD